MSVKLTPLLLMSLSVSREMPAPTYNMPLSAWAVPAPSASAMTSRSLRMGASWMFPQAHA